MAENDAAKTEAAQADVERQVAEPQFPVEPQFPPISVPPAPTTPCIPVITQVIGLIIYVKTMNENLDIDTFVFAEVHQAGTLITRVAIAAGEVEEWQDHAPAPIPFPAPLTNPTGLSLNLHHPGISNNVDPHWRMSFSLEAVLSTGQRRACVLTLQSSPIYVGDHGGQLNFEGNRRSSGRIPFLINY
jgi:hypothetical protein